MFMKSSKITILDDDNDDNETFYCLLCEYPLVTKNDFELHSEYNCCNECYLTFAETRKKKWAEGWRPKRKVLDSYITNKRKLYEMEVNVEANQKTT